MKNYVKCIVGVVNMAARVSVFIIFWWAFADVADQLRSDDTWAFDNEYESWSERPFLQITKQTIECPSNQMSILNYRWEGSKSYTNKAGQYVPSTPYLLFSNWTTETVKAPFILCGLQAKNSFIDVANDSRTCEERGLRSCAAGLYCSLDSNCPITEISLSQDGSLRTEQTEVLPISQLRIDSDFVCLTSDTENTFVNRSLNSNLRATPSRCEVKDENFYPVNTINEVLFFDINLKPNIEQEDFKLFTENFLDARYNKTLFFKRYPQWNRECYGQPFSQVLAFNLEAKNLARFSEIGYLASVAYLLVVCYLFPGLTVFFRCIEACSPANLLPYDYFIRFVLTVVNVAYSVLSLLSCIKLIELADYLLSNECTLEYNEKITPVEMIAKEEFILHIVALVLSFGVLSVEFLIWFFIFFGKLINRCKRFFRKREVMHNIEGTPQDHEMQALQE